MLNYFERIPRPGYWLGEQLVKHDIPKGKFARHCCTTASHFSNYLSGREPIPTSDMLLYLQSLPDPTARKTGELIHSISDVVSSLEKRASKLLGGELINPRVYVSALTREAESLVTHVDRPGGSVEFYTALREILVAAQQALHAFANVVQARKRSEEMSLVTKENARDHVRFPMAQLIGALMQVHLNVPSIFRNKEQIQREHKALLPALVVPLTEQVRKLFHQVQSERLQSQAALYLLARFGQASDLPREALKGNDVETKRMAYCGLSKHGQNEDIMDRFLNELERDEALTNATVAFDAMHYGDAELNVCGDIVRIGNDLGQVINHAVRHYSTTSHQKWADFSAYKILTAMEMMGPRNLSDRVTIAALDRFESLCKEKEKHSKFEEKLLKAIKHQKKQ